MLLEVPSSADGAAVSTVRLSAGQSAVIGRFFRLRRPKMVGRAIRLLRRASLGDARLSAEDAVNGALVKLCQAMADGRLAPIETRDDFVRAFRLVSRQHIRDEWARETARKRGGPGEASDGRTAAFRVVDTDVNAIDRPSCPPDVLVIAEQQVEWSLALLDEHDSALRVIVRMKMENFTNQEIAADLGLRLWIIEKQLRQVRSILEPYFAERE